MKVSRNPRVAVSIFAILLFVSFITLEGAANVYQVFFPIPIRQNVIFGATNGRDDQFVLQANADGSYSSKSELGAEFVDSTGNRFPVAKDKNVIRIVCLGGSTTNGVGADKTHSYPALLGDLLNAAYGGCGTRFEVMNCGYMGYHSWHSRLLTATRIVRLNPDVVTILQGTNDLMAVVFIRDFNDVLREQRRILNAQSPGLVVRFVDKVLLKLQLTISTYRVGNFLLQNIRNIDGKYLDIPEKLDLFGYTRNLRAIIDQGRQSGFETVVLNYPWLVKTDDQARASSPLLKSGPLPLYEAGRKYFDKANRELCQGTDARFADLLSDFDDLIASHGPEIIPHIYSDQIHFTKEGNYFIAKNMVKEILDVPAVRDAVGQCQSLSLQEGLTILHPHVFFKNGWPQAPSELQPLVVTQSQNASRMAGEDGPPGWSKWEAADQSRPAFITLRYTKKTKQDFMPANGLYNSFFYPRTAGSGTKVRVLSGAGEALFALSGRLDNASWSDLGDKYGINLPDLRPGETITVELTGKTQVWCPPDGFFFTNDTTPSGQ